jgi:DNA polymerase-1
MSGDPTVVAFDTETHLIQAGLLAPPLVIGSLATADGGELLSADGARSVFRELMRSDLIVAFANAPFDMAVLLADAERRSRREYDSLIVDVFDKYERGEVYDILIGQALDAIARGHLFKDPRTGGDLRDPITREVKNRYSLAICTDINLGRKDAKADDYWRDKYAILEHVPMSEWPPDARKYPVDDARNTRDNALFQRGGHRLLVRDHEYTLPIVDMNGKELGHACEHCETELGFGDEPICVEREILSAPFRNLEGMPRDTRADLVLHLGAVWGLRTNRAWVEALTEKVEHLHADYVEQFTEWMKAGHRPGCLKRMAAAGVDVNAFRGRDHCVTTCTNGKENGPLVTRLVAEAYGATGVCPSCGGTGRRAGAKGNPVGCAPRNFKEDGSVTCDTTGLDLTTAPMLPRTDGGGVKCDRDSLIDSGDERLMAYGDDEFEKVRGTYLPYLRKGLDYPLNLRPNAMLETFRMSYSGPSQQMPRDGEPRVCHEARPGFYYFSDDYSGIELCTLAQVCLWKVGFSRMADIVNASGDPGALHAAFGAQMAGLDVAEFTRRVKAGDREAKDFRQAAKAANFGYPGGMGAAKLVLAKRKKSEGATYSPTGPKTDHKGARYYDGIRFCILLGGAERCGVERVTEWRERPTAPVCRACCEQAEILRNRWMETFPEIRKYFNVVSRDADDHGEVRLPFPGCVRGGVGFTDGANGNFQELAALLMREAMWRWTRECYVDQSSVLYGTTRVPVVIHDEAFGETRIDTAHLAAARVGTIMVEAGRHIVPNVTIKVEPALSRRWLKAAEPAYDASGKLIPWEDSPQGAKYLEEKGWTL